MPTSGKYFGKGFRHVGGLRHLDRFAGAPMSPMQRFLYPLAWRDVVFENFDFNKGLESGFWITNTGTGGTAFAIPGTTLAGGALTGATGTDGTAGNRVVNLYGPRNFLGDQNCGVEFRMKVGAAATNIEWTCGWIDTHTTLTTPIVIVADIDTPTFGAGIGDAALVSMDTAETLTTAALCTLGSGALDTGTKTLLGTFAPTAATYFTVRVQLVGNDAFASIEDATTGYTAVSKIAGIEGGTLVRPIVVISGPTATTKTWDIDRITVWQDR